MDADPALTAAVRQGAFAAVSAAFGSLGRVCLSLDGGFRVRYASALLDTLLGPGAAEAAVGRPIDPTLGEVFSRDAGHPWRPVPRDHPRAEDRGADPVLAARGR